MPIDFGCAAAARTKGAIMSADAIDTSLVDLYTAGRTTVFAYPLNPRGPYCLNVPPIDEATPPPGRRTE